MTPNDEEFFAERLGVYRAGSVHYMQNAHEFLTRHEYTKASEFLWGAVAQATKAVAASNGKYLAHHGELWDYSRELAKELDDPGIFQDFRQANSLHRNFYESGLPPEEVFHSVATLGAAVEKLLNLLPEEASRE